MNWGERLSLLAASLVLGSVAGVVVWLLAGSWATSHDGPILINRLSQRAVYLESDDSAVMVRLFGTKLDVQVWEQDSPSPIRPKPLGDKPTWIGGKIGEEPKP